MELIKLYLYLTFSTKKLQVKVLCKAKDRALHWNWDPAGQHKSWWSRRLEECCGPEWTAKNTPNVVGRMKSATEVGNKMKAGEYEN